MGTLGDNLLKLTEFPFSYSLIGLLALIFGEGLNLEEGWSKGHDEAFRDAYSTGYTDEGWKEEIP